MITRNKNQYSFLVTKNIPLFKTYEVINLSEEMDLENSLFQEKRLLVHGPAKNISVINKCLKS